MPQQRLRIVPISLKSANLFVAEHHRHHRPVRGHKYAVACASEAGLCGVAIVGRPVARHLDDCATLEVTRVATDGTPNACSFLYGAAWRVARALGYGKMVTYILDSEPGTSLRAAGWRCAGPAGGGSWNCPSRPRVDAAPTQPKLRWEVSR